MAQVYIPTGTSTQSGIVRNVPTHLVQWPANTYITSGNRAYVAAQLPLSVYGTRSNADNQNQYSNDQDDSIRRYISEDTEERLRNFLRTSSDPDSDLRQSLSNSYGYRLNSGNNQDSQRAYNDNDLNSRQRNTLNRSQLRSSASLRRNNDSDNDNDDNNNSNNSNSNNNRYNHQRGNDDSDSNQSNNQN